MKRQQKKIEHELEQLNQKDAVRPNDRYNKSANISSSWNMDESLLNVSAPSEKVQVSMYDPKQFSQTVVGKQSNELKEDSSPGYFNQIGGEIASIFKNMIGSSIESLSSKISNASRVWNEKKIKIN